MRVKKSRKVGDIAWSVDWTANIPVNEFGESDMDAADERCERFTTEVEAIARANEVVSLDAYGFVPVTKCEFVPYDEDDAERFPHAGFWEDRGEVAVIEKDKATQ